jgi:hypothetical protein
VNTDIYSTIARAALGDAGRVRLAHIRGFAPILGSHEMTVGSRLVRHVWRDEPSEVFITSTSSDDVVTERGALGVKLWGLDTTAKEVFDVVEMRGAAGVKTEQQFLRINGAEVVETGSLNINVGDIDIGDQGVIARGAGCLTQAVYTVPGGYEALIVGGSISSYGKAGATWRVRVNENVIDWGTVDHGSVEFSHPYAFPATTDIEVTGQSMGVDTNMRAALDVVLFPRG